MQRTTVTLGEPLLRDLHRMAEERRTSVSAIIREAVEEKLSTFRPKPKSLGIAASGYTDTARRASDERPEPRSWR